MSTFLQKLQKEKTEKQTYQLPISLINLIKQYEDYGKTLGVEIDTSQLVTESLKDTLAKEKEFQGWLKKA